MNSPGSNHSRSARKGRPRDDRFATIAFANRGNCCGSPACRGGGSVRNRRLPSGKTLFRPQGETAGRRVLRTDGRARKPYRLVEPAELERIAGTLLHGGIVALARSRPVQDFDPSPGSWIGRRTAGFCWCWTASATRTILARSRARRRSLRAAYPALGSSVPGVAVRCQLPGRRSGKGVYRFLPRPALRAGAGPCCGERTGWSPRRWRTAGRSTAFKGWIVPWP